MAASTPIQTLMSRTGTSPIAMFSSSGSQPVGMGRMPQQGQLMLTTTPLIMSLVYKQELMSQTLLHKLAMAMNTSLIHWGTVGPKPRAPHGETATLVRSSTSKKCQSSWWVLQCSVFCEEELKQLLCAPGLITCPSFLHNSFL